MKTTLPEKWYILRSEQNYIKVNKWFNEHPEKKILTDYFDDAYTVCFPEMIAPNAFVETKPYLGYEEISFPEFQVMVLEEFPENWNIKVDTHEQFVEVWEFIAPDRQSPMHINGTACPYLLRKTGKDTAYNNNDQPFGYEQETRITWEQFKKLKSKQMGEIDYTIAGTPLLTIPSGTEYRVVGWDRTTNSTTGEEKAGLVSYGKREYLGETYVLAERPKYTSELYYMFKSSTIQ